MVVPERETVRTSYISCAECERMSYLCTGITERFEASALLVLTYVTTRSIFEFPTAIHPKINCRRRRVPTPLAACSTYIWACFGRKRVSNYIGAQALLLSSSFSLHVDITTMDHLHLHGCYDYLATGGLGQDHVRAMFAQSALLDV